MSVDEAAVTGAEAAQYRAAGWWSDVTLSDCVRRNAASSPDQPAYIDFTLDSADRQFTWTEFDHAATNLACALRRHGVSPGDRVGLWHKDSAAIHIALVAGERCGASVVGLGSRVGIREAQQILRTTQPALLVADAERHELATQAADPSLRVVALGADLDMDTRPPDPESSLSPTGPDDVFLINSTSGTTGMPKCVVHTQNRWHYFHLKAVANGAAHHRRRVSSCHSNAVRIRDLDVAHHTDPSRRDDRQHRALRPGRDVRGDRAAPRDGVVLRQHAIGDAPGRPGIAGPRSEQPAGGVHRR